MPGNRSSSVAGDHWPPTVASVANGALNKSWWVSGISGRRLLAGCSHRIRQTIVTPAMPDASSVRRLDASARGSAGTDASRPNPTEPATTTNPPPAHTTAHSRGRTGSSKKHQPEIRFDRDRRATLDRIEEPAERPEIAFVIQQPIDLSELTRQHPHPHRQQQLEQRALRTYSSQHAGPHPCTRRNAGLRTEHTRDQTGCQTPE